MNLAPVLDLGAAGPLWESLKAARGQPLSVDASAVERMGGLCLQALLAAQQQWREDGVVFSVVNVSEAFLECVNLMGAYDLAPQEEC